jgi:hypothetical protein
MIVNNKKLFFGFVGLVALLLVFRDVIVTEALETPDDVPKFVGTWHRVIHNGSNPIIITNTIARMHTNWNTTNMTINNDTITMKYGQTVVVGKLTSQNEMEITVGSDPIKTKYTREIGEEFVGTWINESNNNVKRQDNTR